jgi:RNA polymerase sigma-70 factor (ECF subfamily)
VIATVRHQADEERDLAARAGQGDHAAFAVLFERYKAGIYRFCLYMLDDAASADDIYQEVFINFYRACREGKEMTNVRGYLMTAARTRCLNALKSARRLSSLEDHDDESFEPDETLSDTAEHLRDALQRIPAQYREVFLLFELEGYSYHEIGEQLGITHDVIKNRIYRAKQALQKILRPLLRDEG